MLKLRLVHDLFKGEGVCILYLYCLKLGCCNEFLYFYIDVGI